MSMKVKAIIFDLDGTLIDSLEDIADSVNEVLQEYHYPLHTVEDYRSLVGYGANSLVRMALPESSSEDQVQEAFEKYQKVYSRNWNKKSRPYDGICDLLELLKRKEIKISVLTNKIHSLALPVMDYFFPEFTFDVIRGEVEGIPKKPDPQGAISIAEKLSISSENIIFLGDTGVDMKTAVNAGMIPVGALWGFREARELKETGAQYLIRHPMEMVSLLEI